MSIMQPTLYGANQVGFGAARDAAAIAAMEEMGMAVLRIAWQWNEVEPTQGQIFWSGPDTVYADAMAAGVKLIFCFYGSPPWANGGLPRNAVPTYLSPTDATWQANFASFVAAFVARYGADVVIAYEISNEPNTNYATPDGTGSFWQENGSTTTKPKVAQYLSLFNTVRAAGKAVNGNATFSTAGVSALTYWPDPSGTPGIEWLEQLMAAGIVADQFSAHAYTSGGSLDPTVDSYPHGNSFKDIGRLQASMVARGYGDTPLRIGEYGNYSAVAAGGEDIKARFITSGLELFRSTYSIGATGPGHAGVTHVTYFPLNNYSRAGVDTTDTGLYTGSPVAGPNVPLASGVAWANFFRRPQCQQ
jgi:hypothetical protein